MDPSGVACTNCGKTMTTDDLRRTSCVHCGQVLAHHARAAQQVAVVNQMLAQGLPQQVLAQQYMQPPYGQPPYGQPPYGQPPYGQPPYGQPPYGQPGPPMMGAPYGAPMPYAAQMAQANAMNQVGDSIQKAATGMAVIIIVAVVAVFVLIAGLGVLFAVLR